MSISQFKQTHSLEKRKSASSKLLQDKPHTVPVIVAVEHLELKKRQYLVPKEICVGKFVYEIRRNIVLDASKSIFLFIGEEAIPNPTIMMGQLYNKYKDEDGFLYIDCKCESVFGGGL